MKRAELIIGQTYYITAEAGWRNKTYRANKSYFATAQNAKGNKVTIVETQLKTEHERKYRTRDVLVRYESGRESWEPLNHIRCTWKDAIRLKTQDYRRDHCQDERGRRYAQHLARKQDREQYKPALKTMLETIGELTGKHVSAWRTVESAFSIEQLQTINEALSLLKTQKPALKEVA